MQEYYLNLLKEEYTKRVQINSSYSLRSFSRDLSTSPAMISEIFNKKKTLSKTKAIQISQKLNLKNNTQEMFILSAQYQVEKNLKIKEKLKKQFEELFTGQYQVKSLDDVDLKVLSSWKHSTLLELFEILKNPNKQELAQRLGVNDSELNQLIQQMVKIGQLKKNENFYKPTYFQTSTTDEQSSILIKNLHQDFFIKAIKSMYMQSPDEREFQSATFAFNSKKTKQVKAFLKKMKKEFLNQFYSDSDKNDSVYQFSFQFYRLDHKVEGK
jgi:uncharacterized protein (TIGR02147 family)